MKRVSGWLRRRVWRSAAALHRWLGRQLSAPLREVEYGDLVTLRNPSSGLDGAYVVLAIDPDDAAAAAICPVGHDPLEIVHVISLRDLAAVPGDVRDALAEQLLRRAQQEGAL